MDRGPQSRPTRRGGVMGSVCVGGGDVKRDSPAAAEGHPAANTHRAPIERSPTPALPHLLVAPAASILPPSSSLCSSTPRPPSSPPDAPPRSGTRAPPARRTQQGRDPLPNPRGVAGARPPAPQPPEQMQAAASGPLPGPASPPRIPPARPLSAARHAPAPGAPLTHQGADLGPAPAPGSRLRGSSSLRPPRLPGTPPPQADPGSYCSALPSR